MNITIPSSLILCFMYAVALNGMERSSHNPHAQTKPIDIPCQRAERATTPDIAGEYASGCFPGSNHGGHMKPPVGSPSHRADIAAYADFPSYR